jgi:hypothetical protein
MFAALNRSRRIIVLACAAMIVIANRPAAAIDNGVVDALDLYPSTGAIVVVEPPVHLDLLGFPEVDVPWELASGVLIHPRVMLCAGHTVAGIHAATQVGNRLDMLRVSFSPDAYDPDTWIEIEDYFVHPGFGFAGNSGGTAMRDDLVDVGVLILAEAVTDVEPARLPPLRLLDTLGNSLKKTTFSMVGYGLVQKTDLRADGLRRFTDVGYVNLRHNLLLCDTNVRTGFGQAYRGDSGGPILWNDPETGNEYVVGLVSGWQPDSICPMARADTPGVLGFLDFVFALVNEE